MNITCSAILFLSLTVAVVVIVGLFVLVRFVYRSRMETKLTNMDSNSLIFGLLIVAVVTVGAFLIYMLNGMVLC